jgi:hypothetical protein
MPLPRRFQPTTTPGRIRALAAGVMVMLAGLFVVTGVAAWEADTGLRAIGREEGLTVIASGDVYLALSDMDAQVTRVLLAGKEEGWLCDADPAVRSTAGARRPGPGAAEGARQRPADEGCAVELPREKYEVRREDAQQAALRAVELASDADDDAGADAGDEVRLRTVQALLEGLQQYDRRVQAAMELGSRVRHPPGELPPDALREYRAASALMTGELLPQASNLALGGAANTDSTYRDKRSATLAGRVLVIAVGLGATAVLIWLQLYLSVRFRRWISPPLIIALFATLALTVGSATLLATEAENLRVAKDGGLDPVLTLSRAQALTLSIDVDRSRYLLDPARAERYDQIYFDKSQTILYIRGVDNLESYFARLTELPGRLGGAARAADFGGFYGAEARAVDGAAREQRPYLEGLLSRYRAYQRNDRRVRELAAGGRRAEAAMAQLDPGRRPDLSYLPHPDFRAHDEGLSALAARHRYVLDRTTIAGRRSLAQLWWQLPACVVFIAGSVLAAIRPRLAEYR